MPPRPSPHDQKSAGLRGRSSSQSRRHAAETAAGQGHGGKKSDVSRHNHSMLIAIIVAGGTLACVGLVSTNALIIVLRDGGMSLGIIAAAAGLGAWCVDLLRLGNAERRWQFLLSVGLGLGMLSVLVLGLGMLGLFSRGLWIILLLMFAAVGLFQVWKRLSVSPKSLVTPASPVAPPPPVAPPSRRCEHRRDAHATNDAGTPSPLGVGDRSLDRRDLPIPSGSQGLYWLWLLVIGFGALALLGGTMPPGILWPAEGNGYDVLEYHFGAPRDYIETGRISYLPHNIYSNFPLNIEMLYLLTMILHGDPIRAVFAAKLLNVLLGMLAVGGVWLAGREFGRRSGIISGLLAAGCPFMVYLSGVAYVENGLIFFSALSLAAFLRALRDVKQSRRWMFTSGLLGGLACGCKIAAVPMVAAPMAVAAVGVALLNKRDRRPLRMLLLYGSGCLITLGPWLAKNAVATGNPVFPLGESVFHSRPGIWNDDGAARWREGHRPAPEDRTLVGRMSQLWHEVIGSSLFGPMIGVGLIAGIIVAVMGDGLRTNLHMPHRPKPPPVSQAIGDTPSKRLGRTSKKTHLWHWRLAGVVTGETPVPQVHLEELRLYGLVTCVIMIAMGLIVWSAFSHLVGRFAIVLIIPCSILSGIAWDYLHTLAAKRIAVVTLLALLLWNLTVTWHLFSNRKINYLTLNLFGQTRWITEGRLPGSSHIARLNEIAKALSDTGKSSRILMVGDARRFYLPRKVDYCVVFNRNPFAEAADHMAAEQLLHWLEERDYAFVYVDWSEMYRLRHSRYGFWRSVTVDLFERLTQSGLRPIEEFRMTDDRPPYATLFAVPPPASSSGR